MRLPFTGESISHWKIYATKLRTAMPGAGTPLWYPEPHESGEVQIGDVGFLKEGAFIRLLNVDIDSPTHAVTYWPNPFSPEALPPGVLNILDKRKNALDSGQLTSKGVEKSTFSMSGEVNLPAATIGGGLTVEYVCKEEYGAILNLRSPADACSVYNSVRLKSYILANYDSWYEFACNQLGFSEISDKIIFVHGWVKTSSDWSVAAFTSSGGKWKGAVQAQTGVGAGAGVEYVREYSIEGPVVRRSGATAHSHPMHDSGRHVNRDQCIFVKHYAIKRRWLRPPVIMEAHAGSNELPDYRDDTGGPAVPSNALEIVDVEADENEDEDDTELDRPLDALLHYILENSDAEVALACDDDLTAMFEDRDWPSNIKEYLDQTHPRIEVDDQKRGVLYLLDIIYQSRVRKLNNQLDAQQRGVSQGRDRSVDSGGMAMGTILLGPSRTHTTAFNWPHLYFRHQIRENGEVKSVSLSPNGKLIAAAWDDTVVTIWQLDTGVPVHNLENDGHDATVWAIAFSSDSTHLISGSADMTAIVWDIRTGHRVSRLHGHTGDIMAVSYSPGGSMVATGSTDCTVKLWNPATGSRIHDLRGHSSEVFQVMFTSDERRLATRADTGVMLWDPRSGQHVATLHDHTDLVWCMGLSAQGDRIVTGSKDHSVRVWDLTSGAELVTARVHTESVWAVAFSPDGSKFTSASDDGTIITCDSFTGEEQHVIAHPEDISTIQVVAYSNAGDLIASGASDGQIRLIHAQSGKFVAALRGEEEKAVKGIMFSYDNESIVSFADDQTLRVWNITDVLQVAH